MVGLTFIIFHENIKYNEESKLDYIDKNIENIFLNEKAFLIDKKIISLNNLFLVDNKKLNNKQNLLNIIIYNNLRSKLTRVLSFEDNEIFFYLSGNILNLKDFINLKDENNNYELKKDYIKNIFIKEKINFINHFKGSFTGIVVEKNKHNIYIFNDQISSKPLYYNNFSDEDLKKLNSFNENLKNIKEFFLVSNRLSFISKIRNKLAIPNSPNINSLFEMLSFGYMLNNDTYIENAYKLFPGEYLNLLFNKENNSFKAQNLFYHKLSNSPQLKGKSSQLIYETYEKYKETIKVIFEYDNFLIKYLNYKNKEDNSKHFVFLSGGLDSRIVVGLANKLGYKNIAAINFAQSFSQDNETAQLIAEKFKFDFIFNSLNHGNYLIRHIEEIIKANDGLILFSGAAHMFDTISKINLNNYGLLINGMLIDGFMGGYLDLSNKKDFYKKWATSTKLIDKIENIEKYISKFETKEEFNTQNRGINCITNGFRMIEYFSEFISPSNYIDLVDFVFKLPLNVKYRNGVYEVLKYDLIIKFLPELRWFLYHNNLSPVIANKYISAFFHLLNNIKRILINRPYFSQNPFSKWIKTNPEILKTYDQIFNKKMIENKDNIIKNKELYNDINFLYKNGNFNEKSMVITLLYSIELHKIKFI